MSENARRVEVAILDIDGTLVDSNEAHARAFVDAARELRIPAPSLERVTGLIGMGGDKLIPEAFGIDAKSASGVALDERKGEIFRQRYLHSLRATPGARDLLVRLRELGVRLVVATSAGADDLHPLLEVANVADLVEEATSSSDVEESKPEPDIVEAALRRGRVDAANAVMIGDTPYDVEAAVRAGVRIVAVRSGGWSDPFLAGATAIFDDPADLLERLAESPFSELTRGGTA